MDNQNTSSSESQQIKYQNSNSNIWVGLVLLVLGSAFLLKTLGVVFPPYIFSWQTFLIILGLYIGKKKRFQGATWIVLIFIGVLLMINQYFLTDGELRRFILPIILIGAGLFFIVRPKSTSAYKQQYLNPETNEYDTIDIPNATSNEFVESTSIFGGSKKKVFSKTFKGGEIVSIFGGAEIDLTQADTAHTAVIEVTALFGGATILIPANWHVVSNAVSIFGEVKDKRALFNQPVSSDKTLIIKGTVLFGGIDIKSY